MTEQTHYGFCNICDAICGTEIVVEGRKIVSIRGDARDPFSQGHICPKAIAQQEVHEDPDRLRKPLRRRGRDFEEISFDEALAEAGERAAAIQKAHGDDALALYFGNPIAHNYASLLHLVAFAKGLHTRNVYSSGSVDAFSRMLVSQLSFGHPAILPVPDIERTHHLLVFGANPIVSNGSIMTAPDVKRRFRELRARGGRIVVIDPRRTETADVADEHHFIEPATDALLLFSLVQVIFDELLERLDRSPVRVNGLDEVRALARDFTPEAVSPRVGIAPETIRRIAREFAGAPSATCYGRMGTCVQTFGTIATWLVDVLNVITGNLDRPGGAMFTTPAVDLVGLARAIGMTGSFGTFQSRVRKLRDLNGELPVAALFDELATPGPGQIKGLFTVSGNPVLALPDGARLDALLPKLDLMVSIDPYVNETTRHAHLIIPPTSSVECDHYPLLEHAMAVRNTAHYAPAVFEKEPGAWHDWQLLADLSARIGRDRGGVRRLTGALHGLLARQVHPRRILDLLLRLGPHRLSLHKLVDAPHGIDLGPLEPRLAKIVATRSGAIELAPREIVADVPRLRSALSSTPRAAGEFSIISKRTLRSMNSWLHNAPRLVSGRPRCLVTMHPDDAPACGLHDGELVTLRSPRAAITLPLRVSDEIKPGVLCMPYGWGHDREGSRLTVARRQGGASYNDLLDAESYDPVSGASVLNGVVVRVTRVSGG